MKIRPYTPQYILMFLLWILWIPVILFCSHLLVSGRGGSNFYFISVALVLLALLLGVRWLSIYLDNSLSTIEHSIVRIRKQFLYGFLVPVATILILALIYDSLIDDDAIQPNHLLRELSVAMMFFYVANSFHLVLHIDRPFLLTTVKVEEKKQFHEKVLVYQKGSYLPINLMEIALIYQHDQINWLITFEEEEHILDLSLKSIQEILNAQYFFKINRNQIVHKDAIHKFNAGSYGKINIELKIKNITSTVSKDRAKDFRKWFYK